MRTAIDNIKNSFLIHYENLGATNEKILDELDMAVYQHGQLRDTQAHEDILEWGKSVLERRI